MAENDKADIRKITGAVEDAVTYPILTRDVTAPPSDGTGVSGPSDVSSLDSIAQSTIRQLLGWRYRADDTTGYLAALTKTIQLKEVEGHIEWDVQPQNYMVQADLGQVTGAQETPQQSRNTPQNTFRNTPQKTPQKTPQALVLRFPNHHQKEDIL